MGIERWKDVGKTKLTMADEPMIGARVRGSRWGTVCCSGILARPQQTNCRVDDATGIVVPGCRDETGRCFDPRWRGECCVHPLEAVHQERL